MELHNTVEDIVISKVDEVFKALKSEDGQGKFCTCDQCRMDVICYALNRTSPHYISSHRGASRVQWEGLGYQQSIADINALIHEGIKKVNHNLRPYADHNSEESGNGDILLTPAFNIPTIIGRVFNGNNFEPLSDLVVELLLNGELVPMKGRNWQNPYNMVSLTNGNFSFWPAPELTTVAGEKRVFEYTIRAQTPEFETLNHSFKIAVTSEVQQAGSFNLQRTFKLPDLYMFPPGSEEEEGYSLY